ncbi:MAG: hypothetical protein KTR24_13520 [Saprospiraceae bacterium]|nr:hypothetical protein [Saprospiraceae bacterium]
MLQKFKYLGFALAFLLTCTFCTRDTVEEPDSCTIAPTYTEGARALIANKCSFSGCHDGASGVGNYTTFQGLQRNLENGAFKREVLDARTMPQGSTLTAAEYDLFRCWAENGFPEN